ncbi:hypothetical protein ACJ73_06919 [Blastomyces percursus]|uniref:Uncharacterized protein n=1 Tax=Blastomyces percursus TaxID=1658174 RepID=A0A1J9Q0U9_9EURO|nr:hypothetical protein ACJ73_06919 [Blastomyces percursus]
MRMRERIQYFDFALQKEFTGEATSNRMRAMRNNLADFEQGQIKNYVKRFAYDLESDEEYNSEDFNSDEYYSDDEERRTSGWILKFRIVA